MSYFSHEETMCPCGCGENKTSPILLGLLNDMRERIGAPLYLNSVYRCENHNKNVGGVTNSVHTKGLAADIRTPPNWTVSELASLARELGADGIGCYAPDYESGPSFVHVDVRGGRTSQGYFWEG